MRKRIYKKIYKKIFYIFLVIFCINIYYYRKGINNPENNAVYLSKIDSFIDYIRVLYYTIEEVIK